MTATLAAAPLPVIAARILANCARLDMESRKVVLYHQIGDVESADMHRNIRDDVDKRLSTMHRRAVLEHGRAAVDRALTGERVRRWRARIQKDNQS